MIDSFPPPEDFKGAVQGTLLYLAAFWSCLVMQSFSKYYLYDKKKREAIANDKKECIAFKTIKYYSHDRIALRGDRTVGNYMEQGFIFLPLLWLHAAFVDPSISFTIAAIYTISRLIYPFVYGNKRAMLIAVSTMPGYFIISYLFVTLVRTVGFSRN
ncbi:MAPEG-like protein [Fragilaria crotonensis]|nr:MAPEG-like protein [Fragilaria crotonensis]